MSGERLYQAVMSCLIVLSLFVPTSALSRNEATSSPLPLSPLSLLPLRAAATPEFLEIVSGIASLPSPRARLDPSITWPARSRCPRDRQWGFHCSSKMKLRDDRGRPTGESPTHSHQVIRGNHVSTSYDGRWDIHCLLQNIRFPLLQEYP